MKGMGKISNSRLLKRQMFSIAILLGLFTLPYAASAEWKLMRSSGAPMAFSHAIGGEDKGAISVYCFVHEGKRQENVSGYLLMHPR
jgi:hypothetical protein